MEEFEIKYDFKKLKKIIKKYNILLLLLIPIFFSVLFRAYTYELPLTDEMAQNSVENNIRTNIQQEILSQTKNIDQNTLNILTEQRYGNLMKSNKAEVDAQVSQLSQQIKDYYQDDSGQTYLLAIDPYYYLRQTENLLENGHVGDELKDGKPFDNHMYAPNGKFVDTSFHPWIGAQLHKISQVFGNDSLLKTMFFLPLLFATLAIIPAFFIGRKLSGNLGGLVASFILAIHPTFLGRTPAGFSDTDAYAILFPLLIIWLFLEGFTTHNKKHKYIFGGLAGLATGIFSFSWSGWWYAFDVILGTLGIYFLYLLIKYKKTIFKKLKTKNLLKTGIIYIVSSFIFVSLFKGITSFFTFIKGPLSVLFMKDAAKASLWPNVYTTVAELNSISFNTLVSNLGGEILFSLSVIGILMVLLKRNKLQLDIKSAILMLTWFAVTLFSTSKGIRFVMMMIPVFAIGLGIFFGRMYIFLSNWASKELGINKKLISLGLILLVIISFIPLTNAAENTAKHEIPSMNDAWYSTLTNIKENTPKDSIVNSWWDFGHWFKVTADRPVTFDGASQNTPMAHWVGKVLLTDNEQEAIAILRMLDCGSNDAYDLLLEQTNDSLLTKEVIDEIILKDKNSAKEILKEYTQEPELILKKTHCNPPENYFITSEDMVSKGGVWSHFGSWDFERAFAYNTIKSNSKEKAIEILQEKLDYSSEEASSTYRQLNGLTEREANAWIAPYYSFSNSGQCQTQNNTVYCSNGGIIDLNKKEAYIKTNGGLVPINYRDNSNTYTNPNATNEIALSYFPDSSNSVLLQPELLESMFTELFYYQGKNLNNFEKFDHQRGIDGFEIYVWKVKW